MCAFFPLVHGVDRVLVHLVSPRVHCVFCACVDVAFFLLRQN